MILLLILVLFVISAFIFYYPWSKVAEVNFGRFSKEFVHEYKTSINIIENGISMFYTLQVKLPNNKTYNDVLDYISYMNHYLFGMIFINQKVDSPKCLNFSDSDDETDALGRRPEDFYDIYIRRKPLLFQKDIKQFDLDSVIHYRATLFIAKRTEFNFYSINKKNREFVLDQCLYYFFNQFKLPYVDFALYPTKSLEKSTYTKYQTIAQYFGCN
jgi:hypothetical protein